MHSQRVASTPLSTPQESFLAHARALDLHLFVIMHQALPQQAALSERPVLFAVFLAHGTVPCTW